MWFGTRGGAEQPCIKYPSSLRSSPPRYLSSSTPWQPILLRPAGSTCLGHKGEHDVVPWAADICEQRSSLCPQRTSWMRGGVSTNAFSPSGADSQPHR